jgi:hypothetical protein
VRAANWFALDALSAASGMAIEVDTDSLRLNGTRREVVVRATHPQPMQHASGAAYRSVLTTVEFDCEGQLAGYRDASFHAEPQGQGAVVARDRRPLTAVPDRTMQLLPPRILEQLARAACARSGSNGR